MEGLEPSFSDKAASVVFLSTFVKPSALRCTPLGLKTKHSFITKDYQFNFIGKFIRAERFKPPDFHHFVLVNKET